MGFRRKPGTPDLQTQFEQLLDQVWDSERRERMMDRIDQALALEQWLAEHPHARDFRISPKSRKHGGPSNGS